VIGEPQIQEEQIRASSEDLLAYKVAMAIVRKQTEFAAREHTPRTESQENQLYPIAVLGVQCPNLVIKDILNI
jgi:hypothetical protein